MTPKFYLQSNFNTRLYGHEFCDKGIFVLDNVMLMRFSCMGLDDDLVNVPLPMWTSVMHHIALLYCSHCRHGSEAGI